MPTILYVDPTAIHGGAEEVLVGFMECAVELGYQPVLAVPGEGWLTDRCRDRGIPYEVVVGMPDATTSERWSQQMGPWLATARKLAGLVHKWQPVIVHSNSPRVSYHGGLGARMAGHCATVTHTHDMFGTPFESPRKVRLLSYLADWFLTPSRAVEQHILEHAPRLAPRIQTVYNGWDMDVYAHVTPADLHAAFGVPRDALVIGTAAAMTPWKGQDVLIAAFASVLHDWPQAHLVIAGGVYGGNREHEAHARRLRQQVATLGLERRVTFTGWREDVWSLMRSFDVFAHVPTMVDPLPTAVIHATALGGAIVASRIGGIPEIVADGASGLLVPPGDGAALAGALSALLADPARRAAYGHAAQARFRERFSHRQMREGLGVAYERALARRGVAPARG